MNIQAVKDFASGFKRGLFPTHLDKLMEKWERPNRSPWGRAQGWIMAGALTAITLLLVGVLVVVVVAWLQG